MCARRSVDALARAGVTHVIGIPDNSSGALFDELRRDVTIRLIRVTREGEAFALASGLWLGGATPLVVVQNTGLLESGDALRGTALRMGASLPFVVTGRGYVKSRRAGIEPGESAFFDRDSLIRPDVDSVALLTEPTLRAWGVPFIRCEEGDDPGGMIAQTVTRAERERRPVALVLTRTLN